MLWIRRNKFLSVRTHTHRPPMPHLIESTDERAQCWDQRKPLFVLGLIALSCPFASQTPFLLVRVWALGAVPLLCLPLCLSACLPVCLSLYLSFYPRCLSFFLSWRVYLFSMLSVVLKIPHVPLALFVAFPLWIAEPHSLAILRFQTPLLPLWIIYIYIHTYTYTHICCS